MRAGFASDAAAGAGAVRTGVRGQGTGFRFQGSGNRE
jgi:hypothetical protein